MDQGAWNVECRICGLLPSAENRAAVPLTVAEHWVEFHAGSVAVAGEDWTTYPAISRCDSCLVPVEWPAWLHVAPEPLGEEIGDVDGRWVLCDACHGCFSERRLAGWVRRIVEVSRSQIRWEEVPDVDPQELDVRMRVMAAERSRLLFEKLDEGVRVDRQPRFIP